MTTEETNEFTSTGQKPVLFLFYGWCCISATKKHLNLYFVANSQQTN